MKNYAFNKQVGQVAGRDIKILHSARALVTLHLYHRELNGMCISKRQHASIIRKVRYIESVTGMDKSMVYQRLMDIFAIEGIDTLPRKQFGCAMTYLDNCLACRSKQLESDKYQHHKISLSTTCERSRGESEKRMIGQRIFAWKWNTLFSKPIVAISVMVGLWMVADRAKILLATPNILFTLQCEYGGYHYSVGSVVMQAGTRKECMQTGKHAVAWQPVPLRIPD